MKATSNSTMSFQLYMTLEESEARALKVLVQYGADSFLEMFYKHLGKNDMSKEESGLRSLFESIKEQIPQHLKRIDETRKTFQELNPNKSTPPAQ